MYCKSKFFENFIENFKNAYYNEQYDKWEASKAVTF